MVVGMNKSSKMIELQKKHMETTVHHLNTSLRHTKEYYLSTYNRLPPKVVELEVFTEKVIKMVESISDDTDTAIVVKLNRLKERVAEFQDDYKIYVLNHLIRAYEIELIHRRSNRGNPKDHRET